MFRINPIKTVWINFRCLQLKDAIRLPILVAWKTKLDFHGKYRNKIKILAPVSTGMISFGLTGSRDITYFERRNSYLSIQDGGSLVFHGTARFATHFSVLIKDGNMEIGNNFSCNNSCSFSCLEGIFIGNDVLIGGYVTIRDSDGHTIRSMEDHENSDRKMIAPISIGNHVWICNKVDVLKGCTIEDDCVLAYHTLMVKSIPVRNALLGGIPARIIKENIEWEK